MMAFDLTEARQPFGDQVADVMEQSLSTVVADRYVTGADLAPAALLAIWRSLSVVDQEAIGTKLLEHHLAEIISLDDGLISDARERASACSRAHETFGSLFEIVEAALPQVLWAYPDDFTYVAIDRDGGVLGTVETVDNGGSERIERHTHQFLAAHNGLAVTGEPYACLPDHVRGVVANGGWFGAIVNGRRYPDDFKPVSAGLAT